MRKSWMIMFLAMSLGSSMPLKAATEEIKVIYNDQKIALTKAPVIRFGKVWLPARVMTEQFGYAIEYEKAEKMVHISGKNTPHFGMQVVEAGSSMDDGSRPVLIDGTVYLSLRDVADYLKKDIKWEAQTKTVKISNLLPIYVEESADLSYGELKYNTETGDFYNGKMHIAQLPFTMLDALFAGKLKTANGHVLYTLANSYGEPHINDELYTVYVANGVHYVAKSFKQWMNGENYFVSGNKIVMIDKNVINIFDDRTGKRILQHTISEAPLKAFLEKEENSGYQETDAKMGYMVEAAGDDFVLYRNYVLKTLTLFHTRTNEEVELYRFVYPPEEAKAIEEGPREEGDYLEFVKAEGGMIYLKHIYTGQTYQYHYQ